MKIPGCLVLVVIFIVWLHYKLKKSSPKDDSFWEKETLANSSRKKPLDNLHYITIPENSLPFFYNFDKKLDEIQEHIMELSKKPIVNLTGVTNTELKLAYGAANLDTLSEYDENFTELARTLYEWAKRFNELGINDDAISVLEFGVNCKTDIYNHYMLLGRLYVETGQEHKIPALINAANELNSLNKDRIIKDLEASFHTSL